MKRSESEEEAWRSHDKEQRRRWLRLSALERLRWLDGAKHFVAIAVGARSRGSNGRDVPPPEATVP